MTEHTGISQFPKPSFEVKLFLVILGIVIFEGAFRKWISAGLTGPIILARDGLAIYAVLTGLRDRELRDRLGFQLLVLWTVIVVGWGLLQVLINGTSPLVFLIGLRFWLLYLWLAYVISVYLSVNDVQFVARVLVWTLAVMLPLVVVQFYLPPSSFLNQQVDGDESEIFRVTADIVRTTGTFSFATGYGIFLNFLNPFVLALLADKAPSASWATRAPILIFLLLAVATMVSGSRGAIIMFSAMIIIFALGIFVRPGRGKSAASLLPLIGIALVVFAVPYFSSRAVDATEERFISAADSEDILDRLSRDFFGEPEAWDNFTTIGSGIGSGSNFASVVSVGYRDFRLAETENGRTILEGGVIGMLYILMKISILVWGISRAMKLYIRTGAMLPILIWATLTVGLSSWSMIGQLTVNALGFLLFSLGLAMVRDVGNDRRVVLPGH